MSGRTLFTLPLREYLTAESLPSLLSRLASSMKFDALQLLQLTRSGVSTKEMIEVVVSFNSQRQSCEEVSRAPSYSALRLRGVSKSFGEVSGAYESFLIFKFFS